MGNCLSVLKRVVPIAGILIVLPGCDRGQNLAVYGETERELVELTHRLRLAEYRLGLAGGGDVSELSKAAGSLRQLEKQVLTLKQRQASLSGELATMENRIAGARQMALQQQRASARGRSFESLAMRNGGVYQNAVVTEIDDSGVSIRHEHGTARLRYADLSPEQRAFFGLEEESALAALNREEQEAVAYEQWIEQNTLAAYERNETAPSPAAGVGRPEETARLRALAQAAATDRLRPLAQPATRVGGGTWSNRWRYNSNYRAYDRPTYYQVVYRPVNVLPCPSNGAGRFPPSNSPVIPNPYRLPNCRPVPGSTPSPTP